MAKNINDSVSAALTRLFDRDADLLLNDVNERSITHKLARYLEDEFPNWHVDCEYNRDHDGVKRLKALRKETVTIDNTNGVSVFPDIIIHRRMTDKNHLVIEVKKSTNPETPDFDLEKLKGFKEELGYTHALFILLVAGKIKPEAHLKWIGCLCCTNNLPITTPRVCPECDHVFQGNGWDGIDAHWRAKHESAGVMYEEFWKSLCTEHRGRT